MQNSEAFNRYGQTAFQKNFKNLHSHQQHMTVPLLYHFANTEKYDFSILKIQFWDPEDGSAGKSPCHPSLTIGVASQSPSKKPDVQFQYSYSKMPVGKDEKLVLATELS